ncbi:DUF4158 domain-containing protein [Rhizobium sp. CF122]|uniref:DUF4158 domain-containing protein n=1 Tax=Rhizobium sp. CF122 TaxID=1144312 RepID=UPI003FD674F5
MRDATFAASSARPGYGAACSFRSARRRAKTTRCSPWKPTAGADDLVDYASREETRHEHLAWLRALHGFRTFSRRGVRELRG